MTIIQFGHENLPDYFLCFINPTYWIILNKIDFLFIRIRKFYAAFSDSPNNVLCLLSM